MDQQAIIKDKPSREAAAAPLPLFEREPMPKMALAAAEPTKGETAASEAPKIEPRVEKPPIALAKISAPNIAPEAESTTADAPEPLAGNAPEEGSAGSGRSAHRFALLAASLALAADEIVMSPYAVLGPVDPQINGIPAASIIKVAAEKPLSEIDDQTLILADVGQKAIDQLRRQATALVLAGVSPHAPYSVCDALFEGTAAFAVQEALPVAVHIAESADESSLVQHALGGWAESHRSRGIDVVPRASARTWT